MTAADAKRIEECQVDAPTWWKCSQCGSVFEASQPPEVCPSCGQKCTFHNVSCYTPDCGCEGPDPQLL